MPKPTVEIVVPVYDEEIELEKNITKLYNFSLQNLKKYDWHITIADNASRDKTPIVAAALTKKFPHLSLLRIEQKGRGRAVKRAWIATPATYYVYMDLDLSTDLVHLPQLLKFLEEGADIVIGSRLSSGAKVEGRTFVREFTSRALNLFFIRFLFQINITDAQCGFKGVSRKVVEDLIPKILDNDWFFDGELLIVAQKSGYVVREIPIHWVDNPGSTVRLLSTVWNDLGVIWRLFWEKPWQRIIKR